MEYSHDNVIASFSGAGCSFVKVPSKSTLDSCLLTPDASTFIISKWGTYKTGTIRLKEHESSFKTRDRSKLVHHVLETEHVHNFEMTKVLATGVNRYESRVFLEGIFTKLQPAPLNEAMTLSSEYSIFY